MSDAPQSGGCRRVPAGPDGSAQSDTFSRPRTQGSKDFRQVRGLDRDDCAGLGLPGWEEEAFKARFRTA